MTIPAADGLQLAAHVVAPENPKAAVVLVHGMAEHKERYLHFMSWLSEQGFACVITDLRGHGATASNKEELGYFGAGGSRKLVEDTVSVVSWTREQYPGLKLFLFGHSMGSLIVRCFAREYDSSIDGLLVCGSPSKNGAAGLGKILAGCIGLFRGSHYRPKMMEKLSTGSLQRKFKEEGLENAWLSTNKANVQAYNEDPLCGFRFTANGYKALMDLMAQTYDPDDWTLARPELPVHFIAGADDPCIGSIKEFSRAVSFLRTRGYRTVTSKVYPGLRHEILNEQGKEKVWKDIADILNTWL